MAQASFEKGQVVWAKLAGYPWWPGVVNLTQVDKIEKDGARDSRLKITVRFIGENTQYRSHSAVISANKVVDFLEYFDEHSNTERKVKDIQHLSRCIENARKLVTGDLPLSDLASVNLKLVEQNSRKPAKSPKPVKKPRKQLSPEPKQTPWKPTSCALPVSFSTPLAPSVSLNGTKSADIKQPDDSGDGSRKRSDKLIKQLSLPYLYQSSALVTPTQNQVSLAPGFLGSFLSDTNPSPALLQDFGQWLCRLFSIDQEILQSAELHRALKHVSTVCTDRPESRHLGLLAHKLYLQLKRKTLETALKRMIPMPVPEPEVITLKIVAEIPTEEKEEPEDVSSPSDSPIAFSESDEPVFDKDLRRRVCKSIYDILAGNGFPQSEGQDLALKMERTLRKHDPTMTSGYRSMYKRMAKDIKKLKPEVLGKVW